MGELDDTVALVAGGTGPIGAAVCRRLADDGARIGLLYRSRRDIADAVLASLPGHHVSVGADLTDSNELDAAIARISDALGLITVLVNAIHPGELTPTAVADLTLTAVDEQLSGVRIHAGLCAAVVPTMRAAGGGRVVYVSGALMQRPAAGFGAYGAAKAAASTLTRYLAIEEGRSGITANIVAPGRVVDPDTDDEALDPERVALEARLRERLSLPDFPSPADVADAVHHLVGPAAAAITGQTIWVTGGEPMT